MKVFAYEKIKGQKGSKRKFFVTDVVSIKRNTNTVSFKLSSGEIKKFSMKDKNHLRFVVYIN